MTIALTPEALLSVQVCAGAVAWIITIRTVYQVLQLRMANRRQADYAATVQRTVDAAVSSGAWVRVGPEELNINPK